MEGVILLNDEQKQIVGVEISHMTNDELMVAYRRYEHLPSVFELIKSEMKRRCINPH